MADKYISLITLPDTLVYNIKDADAARASHSHGNISSTGTIGSTANYAVYTTTNGKLTADSFAMDSPAASGTAIAFITSITQSSKGSITAAKATIPTASSSTAGITKVGASGGAAAYSHGNHVPAVQTTNNITFLRNDNNWYKLASADVSTLINLLTTGDAELTANDYVITLSTTTTYHRRKASNVVNGTLVKAALSATATSTNHGSLFLRKDGSWQDVVTSVNSKTGAVTISASDLGLTSALKYVGSVDALPTATATTTFSTYNNGDVITVDYKEYAYVKADSASASKWVELGDEGSYKLKQTAITSNTGTADGTANSTTFVYSFSLDAEGVVSVQYRPIPVATTLVTGIVLLGTGSSQAAKGNHNHDGTYLKSHGPSYGQITVSTESSSTANLAGLSSAVTTTATAANEAIKFTTANKWIKITGSNSSSTGADEIKFGHAASLTAKTSYGSTSATASANGGKITVTDILYDEAGHITASTDREITLSQVTYTLSSLSAASDTHTHGNISNAGAISTSSTIANGDTIVISTSANSGKVTKASITFDASTTASVLSKAGTWVSMYTHPTGAGNKHIPSGGSSGLFLGYDSAGTAKWVDNPNTDTKVNVKLATTSKAYLLGVTTAATSTTAAMEAVSDTGVYLDTTAGQLTASKFYVAHTAGGQNEYRVTYGTTVDMAMMIGRGNENHGLYDLKLSRWIIYANTAGTISINGSGMTLTGTAAASWITTIEGTTASTSTSTGALLVKGGVGVGGLVTALRVGINGSDTNYSLYVNGSAYFNNSVTFANKAFNYSGMENAETDASRNIWFSDASTRGKPVYNNNFKYNPNKALLIINSAILESLTTTAANTDAWSILTLGNNANKTTTTAHSEGKIILYSAGTLAHTIVGANTTTAYTHTLPNKTGTIAMTSDFENVSNNATLNGTTGNVGDMLYWSDANTPARLSIGVANKILKSNGETPEWADEYQVEIIDISG